MSIEKGMFFPSKKKGTPTPRVLGPNGKQVKCGMISSD